MEECLDSTFGIKRRQSSVNASGVMRLRVGRERRKGGRACWREMADM